MATESFTELQLDALRELANIGSGNAGTALGAMLGKSIEISVPAAAGSRSVCRGALAPTVSCTHKTFSRR